MENDTLAIYSGEGNEAMSKKSEYEILSDATQLMLIGGVGLATEAMNFLGKINKNRNLGHLNFITTLNNVEEIKLAKVSKKFKKVYKISNIGLQIHNSTLFTSTLLRCLLNKVIQKNDEASTIIPQVTTSISILLGIAQILSTISGRVLLHYIPEESVFSYDVTEEAVPRLTPVLLGMNVLAGSDDLSKKIQKPSTALKKH